MSDLTRPIIGIENRSAQEVFDIMCDRFKAPQAEIERLKEALTPSGETKAAYIGEFQFTVTMLELDESDEPYECQRMVTVPWTTIKEIMAAISERAERSKP